MIKFFMYRKSINSEELSEEKRIRSTIKVNRIQVVLPRKRVFIIDGWTLRGRKWDACCFARALQPWRGFPDLDNEIRQWRFLYLRRDV